MASYYLRPGHRFDYTATGAAVAAGDIVFVGLIACLAENAIAEDETGSVLTEGNVVIPKAEATSLAVGALVELAAGLAVAQGAGGGKVVGTVVVVRSTTEVEVALNKGIAAIASD